jgi:Arc/MetJ-type ribon-helix-helix transcriptional regulator
MSTQSRMPRKARLAVRLSESEEKAVRETAKARGYTSPSAFIRAAIRNEMNGPGEWTEFEQRVSSGIERTNEEVARIGRGQQAALALLDALTKTVLTCVPEPPPDARNQAVARARERYDRLIKTAGRTMAGDGHTAIRELVSDAAAQR